MLPQISLDGKRVYFLNKSSPKRNGNGVEDVSTATDEEELREAGREYDHWDVNKHPQDSGVLNDEQQANLRAARAKRGMAAKAFQLIVVLKTLRGGREHPVSEAQRRWAYAAEEKGELPEGKAHEWSKRVEGKKLPKHTENFKPVGKAFPGHKGRPGQKGGSQADMRANILRDYPHWKEYPEWRRERLIAEEMPHRDRGGEQLRLAHHELERKREQRHKDREQSERTNEDYEWGRAVDEDEDEEKD